MLVALAQPFEAGMEGGVHFFVFCFGSQGVILDAFLAKELKKNVNGTRDPTSPPFMANAIKSFHFFNPESEQRALPAVPVAMLHFNCKRA